MQQKFTSITWKVIHWKKLWRTIWFPTANLFLSKESGIKDGTYKVCWLIEWEVFRWVWVFRENLELFEAHFFDFSGDLYGQNITVMLRWFIRENKKFDSLEAIKKQIELDVSFANTHTDIVLSFGTFDTLHPWHSHYLNSAKMYSDTLVTIVATDENVEKLKQRSPKYSLIMRVENLKTLGISDIVCPWSNSDPLQWLDTYKPTIICLWYDQVWFSENIHHEVLKRWIHVEIIRIWAFKPEIYKSSKLR